MQNGEAFAALVIDDVRFFCLELSHSNLILLVVPNETLAAILMT